MSIRSVANRALADIAHRTIPLNPLSYPRRNTDGSTVGVERSDELIARSRELGIDAIVAIGGDGSLEIAQRLFAKGVHIVGVPKTIDNDVSGTVTTFGFDTAV